MSKPTVGLVPGVGQTPLLTQLTPAPAQCGGRAVGFQSGSPAASSVFHFRADHSWWWVPVAAPILGCLAGVFIYKACIGFHNEPDHETENKKEEAGTETSKL